MLAGVVLASVLAFRSTDSSVSVTTAPAAPAASTPATTIPAPATTTSLPDTTTTTEPETTATTEPTTTTTTIAVTDTFILRPDGIDRIFFGTEASDVIAGFTDRLGEPDDDTGWVNNLDRYDGLCLGTEVRFVGWGSLQLFFTDGPSDWEEEEGVEHFASYQVSDGPDDLVFRTSLGISVGDTVSEIEAVYGDSARVYTHPVYEAIFEVDPPGNGILLGLLTGLEDDDTVIDITGGFACGE